MRRRHVSGWFASLLFLLLIACSKAANAPDWDMVSVGLWPVPMLSWTPEYAHDGVAASWDKARIYLPYTSTPTTLEHIPTDKAYPVLLFLHGCWGFSSAEHANWATLMAAQGLLVVMPDRFARPDKTPSCEHFDNHGGLHPPVHDMRLAEIEYASQQIRKQPWFDGKNLLLMGYSEGAIAVVKTPLKGFRGVIAVSWSCTHWGYPPLHGIGLPSETPLLTIAFDKDPWFPSKEVQGNCGERMAGRADSHHLTLIGTNQFIKILLKIDRRLLNLFDDHGRDHSTYQSEKARQTAIAFVRHVIVTP